METSEPFVPSQIKVEPSGRYPIESIEESTDIPMDVIDPFENSMVLWIGSDMCGNGKFLHYIRIWTILVRIDDSTRTQMALKGTDSYLLGQRSPAAYIEEEVVTIV